MRRAHPAAFGTLPGTVEEEGAEDGNPHAVTEHGQVGLCELKGGGVLIHQLPNAVQEE